MAVLNAQGTVIISGGIVAATTGTAFGSIEGTAVISGGTVSATAGNAIAIWSAGHVTVSETAVVTSNNHYEGTIYIDDYGTNDDCRLSITGGTIENKANGHAIDNTGPGAINVNGGRILAKEGYAIRTTGTGALTLNSGIVFAYGEDIMDVIFNSPENLLTGNAVIAAWNEAAGKTNYIEGTNVDIFVYPATSTAVWAVQDGDNGILVTNEINTGFIPLSVAVTEESGITEITNEQVRIYPNPTTGQLFFENSDWRIDQVKILDVSGRTIIQSFSHATSETIDISHLSSGTYFVKITTNKGDLTKKVIKK